MVQVQHCSKLMENVNNYEYKMTKACHLLISVLQFLVLMSKHERTTNNTNFIFPLWIDLCKDIISSFKTISISQFLC